MAGGAILVVAAVAFLVYQEYGLAVGVDIGLQANRFAERLPEQRADARALGLPLSPEDLSPPLPIPDRENAAVIYRALDNPFWARAETKRKADADAVVDFLDPRTREAHRSAAAAVLRREQGELARAEYASSLPHCDFHRDWSKGPDVSFRELALMRQLVRLFSARAILNKEKGLPLMALRDVATAARIANQAGSDPFMVAALVQIAGHAIANRPFVEILQAHGSRPDVLQAARQTEASFHCPPDISHALREEVVMSEICADQARNLPDPLPDWLKDSPLRTYPATLRLLTADAFEDRMLAYWCDTYRALRKRRGDTKQTYDDMLAIQRGVEKDKGIQGCGMAAILTEVYPNLPLKCLIVAAQQSVRRCGEAILAYRIRTGKYPDRLNDLGRNVPTTDPYTDLPLHYRRTGAGFIVYSVGENLRDDGGDDSRGKDKIMKDVVFKYP